MTDSQYQKLSDRVESLKGSGVIEVRYDMGGGIVESVVFTEIWIKINPRNAEPTRILKKTMLG